VSLWGWAVNEKPQSGNVLDSWGMEGANATDRVTGIFTGSRAKNSRYNTMNQHAISRGGSGGTNRGGGLRKMISGRENPTVERKVIKENSKKKK